MFTRTGRRCGPLFTRLVPRPSSYVTAIYHPFSTTNRRPADPLVLIHQLQSDQVQKNPASALQLLMDYLSPTSFKKDIYLLHKTDPAIISQLVNIIRTPGGESNSLCDEVLRFLGPLDNKYAKAEESNVILQSLTWERSSAQLIENLQKGERVRPLQNMEEVKHRLGAGRRCYALFDHQDENMSDPLIFVWVALRKEITAQISEILSELRPDDRDESKANTAVFYGISSSGRGMKGAGNLLIKEACRVLCAELPRKSSIFPRDSMAIADIG